MEKKRPYAASAPGHNGAGRWKFLSACLAVASLTGCANPAAISAKEDNLVAAGFVSKPAATPEQQAMFHALPAGRFLQRASGDTYVFADPIVCNCLYIGTKANYMTYVAMAKQRRLGSEEQFKADMYQDPSWKWGSWAPGIAGYGF